MAKDSNIRRLPGAGDGPLEPEDPRLKFARRMDQSIDDGCDQIIAIVCHLGRIVDIVALRDNRHEMRGILAEVFPIYDSMTSIVCTCDCEE